MWSWRKSSDYFLHKKDPEVLIKLQPCKPAVFRAVAKNLKIAFSQVSRNISVQIKEIIVRVSEVVRLLPVQQSPVINAFILLDKATHLASTRLPFQELLKPGHWAASSYCSRYQSDFRFLLVFTIFSFASRITVFFHSVLLSLLTFMLGYLCSLVTCCIVPSHSPSQLTSQVWLTSPPPPCVIYS